MTIIIIVELSTTSNWKFPIPLYKHRNTTFTCSNDKSRIVIAHWLGLFHKAIAQSGHAMNYRAIVSTGQNLRKAWQFAKIVGCDNPSIINSETLVECLRTVDIQTLTIGMYGLMVYIPNNHYRRLCKIVSLRNFLNKCHNYYFSLSSTIIYYRIRFSAPISKIHPTKEHSLPNIRWLLWIVVILYRGCSALIRTKALKNYCVSGCHMTMPT